MARILFIDDDALALSLMSRVAELLGHQALVSTSGKDAVSLAQRELPELILVDRLLPDQDGIQVIRNLRSQAETSHTPILMISADLPYSVAEQAQKAGAQGCLEKPIGFDSLVQAIRAHITQS